MSRGRTGLLVLLAVVALAIVVSSPAAACSACFGNPDAAETRGVGRAVLFLLSIIGLVQVGFVSLFWQFRKRSKSLEERKGRFRILRGGIDR